MIETEIKEFLDGHLSVPSFLERPEEPPDFYILFEKTSGGSNNYLPSSTIAFQSYAPSLYEAAALNEKLKIAVESMITLDSISKIKLNSDYNFTDTETKEYRYQAVYDINHY